MNAVGLDFPPPGVRIERRAPSDPGVDSNWSCQREGDGHTVLVMREQPTARTDLLIYSVADPLDIHCESHIATHRYGRQVPASDADVWRRIASVERSTCGLCLAGVKAASDPSSLAYAIDNLNPFGPLLHKLVAPRRHVDLLHDIGLADIVACWRELHRTAHDAAHVDALAIGMNFGAYALGAASQPHLHYQVSGLAPWNHNAADGLGQRCRDWATVHAGADYLADYLTALRRAGLVVAENEAGVLFVPIAQRMRHELQFMAKSPGVGNLRDADWATCEALAGLEYHAIRFFKKLDVQAFNAVWHMTRFNAGPALRQRMLVSLCPRQAVIGFFELSGHWVVDRSPWHTAEQATELPP